MMRTELKYYIKRNKYLIISHAFLLSLLFLLVYVFLQFTTLAVGRLDTFNRIYQNNEMFSLSHTLEGDDIFDALEDDDLLHRLAIFYDGLNHSDNIHFLSMHHQFISIRNFRGSIIFDYNYEFRHIPEIAEFIGSYLIEEEWYMDVNSLQMNQQSFEFFDLAILEGEGFLWENIHYSDHRIPILLGADYRGIYEIGDTLEGIFYFTHFEFEVVGFLEVNSTLFYFNDPEYYLDRYIIIPYPSNLQELDLIESDPWFKGILSLAMIGGDLVVERSPDSLEDVLNILYIISNVSGFEQYEILGLPSFTTQYGRMVSILSYNQNLLIVVLLVCIVLVGVISIVVSKFLFKKRLPIYEVLYQSGLDKRGISKLIFRELMFLSIMSLGLFILWIHLSGLVSAHHLLLGVILLYVPFLSGFATVVILLTILMNMTYRLLKLELKKI